jgi:uncharacterized protein YcbK (DUF882 family)
MSALNNGVDWITSSGRKSDFTMKETECKCGCGHNPVHQSLINVLQLITDTLGRKLKLNCVCRCIAHNKKVGGTDNSYHVQGMAADIAVMDLDTGNDTKSELLYDAIKYIGIPCVIEYPNRYFCHIDMRITDAPVRIYKNEKGGYSVK